MTHFVNDIDKHKKIIAIVWFVILFAAIAAFKAIQKILIYILEKLYEIFIQHTLR